MDNGKSGSEVETDVTERAVVRLSSSSYSGIDKAEPRKKPKFTKTRRQRRRVTSLSTPSSSSSSSFLISECSAPTSPSCSNVELSSDDNEILEEMDMEECSQSEGRRVTRSRSGAYSSSPAMSQTARVTRSMTSVLSTENASVSATNTPQNSRYNLRPSQAKRDNCETVYSASGENTDKDSSSASDSDVFVLPTTSTTGGKKTRTTSSTSDNSEDERKWRKFRAKKKVVRKKRTKMAAKAKPVPIVNLCESGSESSMFEKIEGTWPRKKPVKQVISTGSSDNNGNVDLEFDVELEPLNFSDEVPRDDGSTQIVDNTDDLFSMENLNPTIGALVDENGSTDWMNQLLEPDFIADALDQPFDEDFFRAFGCEETN